MAGLDRQARLDAVLAAVEQKTRTAIVRNAEDATDQAWTTMGDLLMGLLPHSRGVIRVALLEHMLSVARDLVSGEDGMERLDPIPGLDGLVGTLLDAEVERRLSAMSVR